MRGIRNRLNGHDNFARNERIDFGKKVPKGRCSDEIPKCLKQFSTFFGWKKQEMGFE